MLSQKENNFVVSRTVQLTLAFESLSKSNRMSYLFVAWISLTSVPIWFLCSKSSVGPEKVSNYFRVGYLPPSKEISALEKTTTPKNSVCLKYSRFTSLTILGKSWLWSDLGENMFCPRKRPQCWFYSGITIDSLGFQYPCY